MISKTGHASVEGQPPRRRVRLGGLSYLYDYLLLLSSAGLPSQACCWGTARRTRQRATGTFIPAALCPVTRPDPGFYLTMVVTGCAHPAG